VPGRARPISKLRQLITSRREIGCVIDARCVFLQARGALPGTLDCA
jgi:hypothetical protein